MRMSKDTSADRIPVKLVSIGCLNMLEHKSKEELLLNTLVQLVYGEWNTTTIEEANNVDDH